MNILTFDIEDWFHILDNASTRTQREWSNYESRIHSNTDRITDFLQKNNLKATFFCLGWIGERYPEVIKKLDNLGYEIGAHSDMHQLIYEQSRDEFISDTESSIDILEQITGKKVKAYRAPGFALNKETFWALEVLVSKGIEIDSSIFPARRGHGGFSTFKHATPCIIEYNGLRIKEFPINTYKIAGMNVVFSGGGYFRLMPYGLINYFSHTSDYIMTYFHPRDFDPSQPMIKDLSATRRFKSYYGLTHSLDKLQKWVDKYKFVDLQTADAMVDWSLVHSFIGSLVH